jgi:hypothetical protein
LVSWIEGFDEIDEIDEIDGIDGIDGIDEIDEIEKIDEIDGNGMVDNIEVLVKTSDIRHSPSDIIIQQPEPLLPDEDRNQ